MVLSKGTMLQFRQFFDVSNMTFSTFNIKFDIGTKISVGAQLAISDPSRTPETLPGEVVKIKKIYTFKLTMGFEVSGSLRY